MAQPPVDGVAFSAMGNFYESGEWQRNPLSGALATFKAVDETSTLGSNGVINFTGDGTDPSGIVSELIPDTDEYGFRIQFNGDVRYSVDSRWPELWFHIRPSTSHCWQYMRLYQPDNFYHRRGISIYVQNYADISAWTLNTQVSLPAGTATLVEVVESDADNRGPYVVVIDATFIDTDPLAGNAITHVDSGATAVMKTQPWSTTGSAHDLFTNIKFNVIWSDDGGIKHGYSNGALNLEYTNKSDGGSSFKPSVSASEVDGVDRSAQSTRSNNLLSDPDHPNATNTIWDIAHNGMFVELVIERARSTGRDTTDAKFKIWKRVVDKSGTEVRPWALIFDTDPFTLFSNGVPAYNRFSHGYLFGWQNVMFGEDTIFYMTDFQHWEEKPDFLITAGM